MGQLKYKPLFPWTGGLNTSDDPIVADPNTLSVADNVVFTTSQSRKKRGGQARYNSAALSTASTSNMVYFTSYWANVSSAKRERFVMVAANGKIFRNVPASTTFSSFNTITLSVSQGGVTSAVLNNNLVLGFSGSNGVPLVWAAQNTAANLVRMTAAGTTTLPFTNVWICKRFIERGFYAGDPANPDTLYVSDSGTYNKFTSGTTAGNSITLIVGDGDGDPSGITAVFPGTAGNRLLYVAKRSRLYSIDCSAADQTTWKITLISDKIGCLNPNAVTSLDETDVILMSDRGVHLLSQIYATTAVIPGEFLSYPIQYDYVNVINNGNRSQISLTYVPSLNSVLFSCKRTGQTTYETVYGFNVVFKQWFRWTSVPCNFLYTRLNTSTGADELYACDVNGRTNKLNQTTLTDFGSAITTTITTQFIYPEQLPLFEYNFTRLFFVFRSRDNGTFSVQYTIDGLGGDSFTVQEKIAGGNTLGTSLLGTLVLGIGQGVKPYGQAIGGYGNSIQLSIVQNGASQDFELFGIILEYEAAGERENPYTADAYH